MLLNSLHLIITYKIKLHIQYVLNCAFMSGENKLDNTLNRQNIGLIGHCIYIKILQSSRKQHRQLRQTGLIIKESSKRDSKSAPEFH